MLVLVDIVVIVHIVDIVGMLDMLDGHNMEKKLLFFTYLLQQLCIIISNTLEIPKTMSILFLTFYSQLN